jgi:hypothetical protein
MDSNNVPTCSCFSGYSGANCDTQSAALKSIKSAISAASWIAIACIVGFYALVVLMDVDKFWRHLVKKRTGDQPKKNIPKSDDDGKKKPMDKKKKEKRENYVYVP